MNNYVSPKLELIKLDVCDIITASGVAPTTTPVTTVPAVTTNPASTVPSGSTGSTPGSTGSGSSGLPYNTGSYGGDNTVSARIWEF